MMLLLSSPLRLLDSPTLMAVTIVGDGSVIFIRITAVCKAYKDYKSLTLSTILLISSHGCRFYLFTLRRAILALWAQIIDPTSNSHPTYSCQGTPEAWNVWDEKLVSWSENKINSNSKSYFTWEVTSRTYSILVRKHESGNNNSLVLV